MRIARAVVTALVFGTFVAGVAACRGGREAAAVAPAAAGAADSTSPDGSSRSPTGAARDAAEEFPEAGGDAEEEGEEAGPAPGDVAPAGADVVLAAVDGGVEGEVPPENREPGERPGPESAEALARRLLAAILADDPTPVLDLVFPVGPFTRLKDLPDPAAYHRRLLRWFEEDVHAKHEELGGASALEFRGFRFGRCEWVGKGGEGNRIPYWSCRRNRILAWTGRREVEVEIRVLIHWGRTWYVTHLGPVRR